MEHPERYKFSPKNLLNEITDIYLNLMKAVCCVLWAPHRLVLGAFLIDLSAARFRMQYPRLMIGL